MTCDWYAGDLEVIVTTKKETEAPLSRGMQPDDVGATVPVAVSYSELERMARLNDPPTRELEVPTLDVEIEPLDN